VTGPPTGRRALEVDQLSVDIALRHSAVHAVDNVSLHVAAGETVAVVGESGCGKSTLGLAIAGLLPGNARARGNIRLAGRELVGMSERELMPVRGTEVAIVFQDPMTSLNPTQRIGAQVGETLRLQRGASKAAAREAAAEMLDLVGLPRPREQLDRFPHELSGGMRQRVVIAAALICEPGVLIADEPTTALDVTTQSQILDLFGRLRQTLGMAMLLVTHDMGVVAGHADRVMVMYAGREAETGRTEEVFTHPRHRYTAALLDSILRMDTPRTQPLYTIPGRPPDLTSAPPGCAFAPRCPAATAECTATAPGLTEAGDQRWRCHHPAGTDEAGTDKAGTDKAGTDKAGTGEPAARDAEAPR
jgi:peptide/nickel transport system ATP-binding protein